MIRWDGRKRDDRQGSRKRTIRRKANQAMERRAESGAGSIRSGSVDTPICDERAADSVRGRYISLSSIRR